MSDKFEGLAVIDVDEAEQITAAVRIVDIEEGEPNDPVQHPITIALRRQDNIDDARVTESATLIRRGKRWFRYDPPDMRLFKRLQKDLTARG